MAQNNASGPPAPRTGGYSVREHICGSKKRFSEKLLPVVTGLLALSIFCVIGHNYLWAPFLVADDSFLVTGFLFDPKSVFFEDGLNFRLLSWLGQLHSAQLLRAPFLLFHAAFAAALYVLFRAAGHSRFASILGALATVVTSVFGRQHVFVTGSHPIFGSALSALALLPLLPSKAGTAKAKRLYSALAFAVLVLATWASPVFILAPLVLPMWLLASRFYPGEASRLSSLLFWAALAGVAIAARFLVSAGHPYLQLEGWRDFSLSNILHNFQTIVAHCFKSDLQAGIPLLALAAVVGGLAAFFAGGGSQVAQTQNTIEEKRPDPRIAFILFVLAGISFGPSSIITFFTDRYSFAPWTFTTAAIIAALPLLGSGLLKRLTPLVATLLVAMIWVKSQALATAQEKQLSRYPSFHNPISKLARENSPTWPRDAQIAVMLDGYAFNPVNSYPHFGTGYLRYAAGRYDIVALIGPPEKADKWPFVPRVDPVWARAPGYWENVQGKSERMRLVGLGMDRPLFAYRQGVNKKIEPIKDVVFLEQGGFRIVSKGIRPEAAPVARWSSAVCALAPTRSIVWPQTKTTLDETTAPPEEIFFIRPLGIGSAEKTIPQGARVDQEFLIFAQGEREVLSLPGIDIVRKSKRYIIQFTEPGARYIFPPSTKSFTLRIWGQEGCAYFVAVDGKPIGLLGASTSGKWTRYGGSEEKAR